MQVQSQAPQTNAQAFSIPFIQGLLGGGLMGYVAGFQDDDAGKAVRSAGRAAATAFRQTAAAFEESGVIDKVSAAVKQKLQ
jgi:hypothetical protein